MMAQLVLRWPRVRPLALLLQSPAHRAMRVLHVTESNWQVGDKRCSRAHVLQQRGLR